ncbi:MULTISPECIES: DUF4399 domain-containing protein [unclassified Wenzhouxiangella]|uniref:DUF4399 domain-containing protein n=1 Tax=unclassified Wenzhouxiangella TaxID=2613841 RepID=UPI000E32914B|nr:MULTISPECIES: DUF4399 domain-containing protein [unclassified Wenzhouxiangella]RFF27553.1 DUF4399 domain-containing protein [Wenzhouxiangella sp. 15181]RFP69585.1 DUF4399 domain-containing protein [Wenzhouxiangella sp. 15190]
MNALKLLTLPFLLLPLLATAQGLERTSAPEEAAVYFITPDDGETVSSPVTVRFGLDGMGVAPAGIDQDKTGHHHLLIDVDESNMPAMDRPLPTTDHVVHFGGGQTEVSIDLEPGEHTLQLLLGDHRHVPHDPAVKSEKITITVE